MIWEMQNVNRKLSAGRAVLAHEHYAHLKLWQLNRLDSRPALLSKWVCRGAGTPRSLGTASSSPAATAQSRWVVHGRLSRRDSSVAQQCPLCRGLHNMAQHASCSHDSTGHASSQGRRQVACSATGRGMLGSEQKTSPSPGTFPIPNSPNLCKSILNTQNATLPVLVYYFGQGCAPEISVRCPSLIQLANQSRVALLCTGWWMWLTLRLPLLGSPQLLQRIALTTFFLALARVGQFIPLPNVDLLSLARAAAGASAYLLHRIPTPWPPH